MKKLKIILLCGALAIAGLVQAGSLTVTASTGGSASLSLTGKGVNDGFVFSPTISADTVNYNLRAAAVSAGWNDATPLTATVTVNPGVYIGSTNTSTYAFDTGAIFPTGSTLKVINNGFIVGAGGAGGSGTDGEPPTAGKPGGPALRAQYALTVTNNGTVGGGGGGGGAGGSEGYDFYPDAGGGGGGGGRGFNGGAGGSSGYNYYWSGGAGSKTAPGAAASTSSGGGMEGEGVGGAGGGLGQAGFNGGNGTSWDGGYNPQGNMPGSAGGAAGAAVTGNANITWTATGTRMGAIN